MNQLDAEIKKYKLDDLLFEIAEVSRRLYLDRMAFTQVEWEAHKAGYWKRQRLMVSAWSLAELSYRAIRLPND